MERIDGPVALPFPYSSEVADEPVITIVEGVARAKGLRPDQLEPFNDVVDVDMVSSLFEDASPHGGLQLTIRYEGCLVTVEPERVWINPDA